MQEKRDTLIKPYKILIVDDDPLIVKTLERILYKRNFLFHSVTSGEKALEAIHDINPDIVLLDVLMSEIDGYEVCRKLKKLPGRDHIPVIFLTSSTGIDDVVKGFKSGAVDYVVKPFNSAELIARLETHLELKRSKEELRQTDLLKTKFFSIMTRDIKNSIIGLKGVASFLLQELMEVDAEANESLKLSRLLVNDSSELYDLLENLIEWASIELGQKKIVIKEIMVCDFLNDSVKTFENAITNKDLQVNIVCENNVFTRLPVGHLESILHGMVSNAVKYSEKGSIINVEYQRKDDQNIFTVTDEGVGMAEDVAENVFRLDTPHPKTIGTYGEKGTGVGLIICKTLIDRVNGTIAIDSAKGKGTRITSCIPDPQES
jgi:two-component system, sensor histidine kinase and response regulator